MPTQQTVTRIGTFDAAHRVMNEKFKCFNVHGHTYKYELTFAFSETEEIGYAIDFKEIKRVMMQWIDDNLDHGCIVNWKDLTLIHSCKMLQSKLHHMSLNGAYEYCNPTAENIAREIFLAIRYLTRRLYGSNVILINVRLWETPNCFVDCTNISTPTEQKENFYKVWAESLDEYAKQKGTVEYDDRKDTEEKPTT
jgi:6-pyruvoyltetrahydropterin/6-carboxytetrahydropterin synthase